ncbi:hypothetical protein, conserved, partial [Eimeria acervulina]
MPENFNQRAAPQACGVSADTPTPSGVSFAGPSNNSSASSMQRTTIRNVWGRPPAAAAAAGGAAAGGGAAAAGGGAAANRNTYEREWPGLSSNPSPQQQQQTRQSRLSYPRGRRRTLLEGTSLNATGAAGAAGAARAAAAAAAQPLERNTNHEAELDSRREIFSVTTERHPLYLEAAVEFLRLALLHDELECSEASLTTFGDMLLREIPPQLLRPNRPLRGNNPTTSNTTINSNPTSSNTINNNNPTTNTTPPRPIPRTRRPAPIPTPGAGPDIMRESGVSLYVSVNNNSSNSSNSSNSTSSTRGSRGSRSSISSNASSNSNASNINSAAPAPTGRRAAAAAAAAAAAQQQSSNEAPRLTRHRMR